MRSSNAPVLRAIRGPIMLMTLGGLFAIDYFGPYPFYRTWPVLLIVVGVLKLAERVVGRDHDSVGGAA
jgi:hypothetical protein